MTEKSSLRAWWSGKLYEGVLTRLHAAEVEITRLTTPAEAANRVGSVLSLARPLCPRDDPRLTLVQQLAAKKYIFSPDRRLLAALAALLKSAHCVEEERAVRSRNFRNRLIRAGAVVLVMLFGMRGAALPIAARPAGTRWSLMPSSLACPSWPLRAQ